MNVVDVVFHCVEKHSSVIGNSEFTESPLNDRFSFLEPTGRLYLDMVPQTQITDRKGVP